MTLSPALIETLDRQVRQALPRQVMDRGRPDHGAFVSAFYGMACADHTSGGLSLAEAALALLTEGSRFRADPALTERVLAAIAATRRLQRSTGLIDLPKVDFDSPPDTAFLVQMLCPVLAMARKRADAGDAAARAIAPPLAELVFSAASGIVGRGFRTPNHRWVVCSALAQATSLFPQLDAGAYVDSILAETIDINADGEYSERSTGIYSAVCNRALRFAADHLRRPELLEHVRANLRFMTAMMDPDGHVVTAISRRQDQGQSCAPVSMADSFYDLGRRDHEPTWLAIAEHLSALACQADPTQSDHSPFWHVQVRLASAGGKDPSIHSANGNGRGRVACRCDGPTPLSATLRPLRRLFEASACWRMRDGATSALAAAGNPLPFSLRYDDLQLIGVRIHGAYFHHAHFCADRIESIPGGVRLTHRGDLRETPGWDLPLDRPVRFDNPHTGYYHLASDGTRQRWELPPIDIRLDIVEAEGGFDLRLVTTGGYDRIPFVIELLLAAGGQLQTDHLNLLPRAGDRVILREGEAIYQTGRSAVRISGGADAHRLVTLADRPIPPEAFCVSIPVLTPVDHTVRLRVGAWSESLRDLVIDASTTVTENATSRASRAATVVG